MKASFNTSILAAALCLAACAPKDPFRATPVVESQPMIVTDRAKVQNEYESPQVDILFVMDNSASMQAHEDAVVANMDKFADSFIKNKDIDFHVGVVKVYDQKFKPDQPGFVPNGQLLNGFVTRDSGNVVTKLQSLLRVPVLGLGQGGPEIEEIFSPIKAALTEPMLSGANAGFYRPQAHLAVIMVTDANDSSPNFDENNLEAFLMQLKNKRSDKFSVYAVLANDTDAGVKCKQDPSGAPLRINNLIQSVGGHKFSLCDSDFGNRLGKVGSNIAAKAIFNRTVELTNIPDPKFEPAVSCEGKKIAHDKSVGWDFDASRTRVLLSERYPDCKSANAEIQVTYTRIDSERLQ